MIFFEGETTFGNQPSGNAPVVAADALLLVP